MMDDLTEFFLPLDATRKAAIGAALLDDIRSSIGPST
jgi:hypothetical protein